MYLMTKFQFEDRKDDGIYHPDHYNQGIEVTDFVSSWKMDWFRGNIIKYVVRAPYKGEYVEDLRKALWYLKDLIRRIECKLIDPKEVEDSVREVS